MKDWQWILEMEKAFINLEECFMTASILTYIKSNSQCIIDTEASDLVLGPVLSQKDDDQMVHRIAYHSRECSSAKIKYKIHRKNFLPS
jgi:hypothetical protein